MRKGLLFVALSFWLVAGSVIAPSARGSFRAYVARVHSRCCIRIDVAETAASLVYELPASNNTGGFFGYVTLAEQLIGEYKWGAGYSYVDVFRPGWALASIHESQGIVDKDGRVVQPCTGPNDTPVATHDWSKTGPWDPSDFSITIDSQNVGPIEAPFTAYLWCDEGPVFPGVGAPHVFGATVGDAGWETLWPGMSRQHVSAFRTGNAHFDMHCSYRTYTSYPGETRKSYVSAGITITSFPEKQLDRRLKATRKMTADSFPRVKEGGDDGFYDGPNDQPPPPWPDGSTSKPTCSHG
jgi:hypothetical protein